MTDNPEAHQVEGTVSRAREPSLVGYASVSTSSTWQTFYPKTITVLTLDLAHAIH